MVMIDNSLINEGVRALRNLRKQYSTIYDMACEWIERHPEKKGTEEHSLIQILAKCADEGMGRCNIDLRFLGEQE